MHSGEPVGQLVLRVPPVMVLCADHAVCTVHSMCAFHWPWCAACCVGSVCTVSSQGCVSFGLAVFLRFCMHWVSCGPHAHCQCPELCVLCSTEKVCTASLMHAFHGPVHPWVQSMGGLLCLGNVVSSVPGCVSLTCMTTSIMGECDLRPQGLPTMLQSPWLPSVFTFPGL